MGMNDLPFITHAPEQERLETPIVNLALILFDQGLDLNVDDSPRKVAFDMRLDIGKVQLEVIQRIIKDTVDITTVDQAPKLQGRFVHAILVPIKKQKQ